MANERLFGDEDFGGELLPDDGIDREPVAGIRHQQCPSLDNGSAHPVPCLEAIRSQIARTGPPPGSIWRHYRGSLYRVVAVAITEAFPEAVVVYTPVDDDQDGQHKLTWVRTLDSWHSEVISLFTKGKIKRFERVE